MIKRCTIAFLTTWSLLATPMAARTVTIVDHSADRQCSRDGAALLLSSDAASRRVPLESDGVNPIAVEAGAIIRFDGRKCWSPTLPAGESDDTLEVYSTFIVEGSFESSRKPTSLTATVSLTSGARNRPAHFDAKNNVFCELDGTRWTCFIPATPQIDLRLEPGEFAPVHFFDLKSTAGATLDLGKTPLAKGSSLAGWVENEQGEPVAGARVKVVAAAGDTSREVAAASTNKRGFFQVIGLPAGEFELVSVAPGLTPVSAPVRVDIEKAITWPRPLVHKPLVGLTIRIDPSRQDNGDAWMVTLGELPQAPSSAQLQRAASKEGLWSATALEAKPWRLTVKDSAGSSVEEMVVDLSRGQGQDLYLRIANIEVTGRVLVGKRGFGPCEIKFTSPAGKSVRAVANDAGEFSAAFPAEGAWTPFVRPKGRGFSEIRAEPVSISQYGPSNVDVTLASGRVVGDVRDGSGKPASAAVHVFKMGSLKAQQMTDEDGRFDFVGLSPGTYEFDAQGELGSTVRPVSVEVDDTEAVELELTLSPSTLISGTVVSDLGAPVSGATIRVSSDSGISWIEVVADVRGSFEYDAPGGTSRVEVVGLGYARSAAIASVALSGKPVDKVILQVPSQGGVIRVLHPVAPSHAFVFHGSSRLSLGMLAPLGSPFAPDQGSVILPPGSFRVCPGPAPSNDCKAVVVTAGGQDVVDLRPRKE